MTHFTDTGLQSPPPAHPNFLPLCVSKPDAQKLVSKLAPLHFQEGGHPKLWQAILKNQSNNRYSQQQKKVIQLSGEGEKEDRTNTELKDLTWICNVRNAAGHLSWEWNAEMCNNRELITLSACLSIHSTSPPPQPSSLLWWFLLVPKNRPTFPCLHPKQEYNRLQTSHSVKKNLKAQQRLAQDHKSWGEDGGLALRGVSLYHTLTAEAKAFLGHSCSLAWASMDCTQFLLHHQFLPSYLINPTGKKLKG